MKQKKPPALKPKLRFPEFREAGWKRKKFDKYLTESRIKGSTGDQARKLTVKLWGKGVFEKEEAIRGSKNTQYYKRKAGQFIYSKLDFLNQAFGVISEELDGLESTVDLPCFDVSEGLNAKFLLEYVQRGSFYKKLGEIADGGRKAKRIQVETFLSFPVFVPQNPAEQDKIASCLSSLDGLLVANGRKLASLKQHKQGLMQQLFPREKETQPRLRFPEFEDAGEWEECGLASICQIQRGKFSHRPRNDPKFFNGPYPFIQTGDVVRANGGAVTASQSLNELGLSVSRLFKPTIVLVTIAANIGDTAILDSEACFTDSVVGLIPKDDRVIPIFLESVVRLKKEYLIKVATEGAQKNINNKILSTLMILVPSIEEQQKIADCLTALDALITAQTQKIAALQTYKKGLMQQLFPSTEEDDA